MPDLLTLFSRWWKAILGVIVVTMAATALVLAFKPGQFVSTVTALPANSVAYDKGNIFNTHIQELYPALGVPDELDRIVGTSKLDTLYIDLVRTFNLIGHYQIKSGPLAEFKAVERLKKNSSVMKSEYGELKIRFWDEDPARSAQLANRYFESLNALHQKLQGQGNEAVLLKLMDRYRSAVRDSGSTGGPELSGRVALRDLIDEYRVVVDAKPPVLLLVEGARPGGHVDRPNRAIVLSVAFFASLLLGLLLAAFLQSRRTS
jgi:hypothetical protein